MNKYFTTRDQLHLLIELVKSLNRGNSCNWDGRVRMAEAQLRQLNEAVERLRERNQNDRQTNS